MEKWHDFGPSRVTWYKSFQITWEWRTYGTHCDRILCSYWANIIQHDKTQQQRMTHIWLIVIVEMIILFSKPKGQSSLFMPPVIHLCHFHGMMWPFQGYYNAFDILSPSVPQQHAFSCSSSLVSQLKMLWNVDTCCSIGLAALWIQQESRQVAGQRQITGMLVSQTVGKSRLG